MIPKSLMAVAMLLIALAVVGAVVGQPTPAEKVARFADELDAEVRSRKYHIDPGELLGLMHDPDIDLLIFDVRGERDYNLFHLKDSLRVEKAELDALFVGTHPEPAVKVVAGNGEAPAQEAWKLLRAQGMLNVYILEGGINFWLDVYGAEVDGPAGGYIPSDHDLSGQEPHYVAETVQQPFDRTKIDDEPRHRFTAAVGSAYPASRPDTHHLPQREFETKVVIKLAGPKVKGGCGG